VLSWILKIILLLISLENLIYKVRKESYKWPFFYVLIFGYLFRKREMEIMRTAGSIILATCSAVLQIPSLDILTNYIPDFMNWGQSASELVKLVYSVCGVIMLISSIKMLKIRRELKEFDLEMKKKDLQDYEELQKKLKDAENG